MFLERLAFGIWSCILFFFCEPFSFRLLSLEGLMSHSEALVVVILPRLFAPIFFIHLSSPRVHRRVSGTRKQENSSTLGLLFLWCDARETIATCEIIFSASFNRVLEVEVEVEGRRGGKVAPEEFQGSFRNSDFLQRFGRIPTC